MGAHAMQNRMHPNTDLKRSYRNISVYVGISVLVFAFCALESLNPDLISRPVVMMLNNYSGKYLFIDRMWEFFALYFTFSGVILCAIILGIWVSTDSDVVRASIITGTCASIASGLFSRYLQHGLSTHLRPYYDSAVHFKTLTGMDVPRLNTWNSFPSDHAAVFGGLVVILFIVRSKTRYVVAAWMIIVESSRVFIGAHFPLDLVGGAALSSAIVWSSQNRFLIEAAERLCRWAEEHRGIFYAALFVLLYQVSTLFSEIRAMMSAIGILHGIGDG